MNRLNICLASMAPFVGGAEVAAERLALGLLEAGHAVNVLLGTKGVVFERMEKAGLSPIFAPMHLTDKWHWLRYARAKKNLRTALKKLQPDIVHSNDLPTHQIMSDAVRCSTIPEICHHRWVFPGKAIDWLNKFGSTHHLFVSKALMNELCAQSLRLAGSRRSVVYDGLPLPPNPAPADRRAARNKLSLPADKTIVAFAGQMIERKGVADLLRAWALLDRPLRENAVLLLIGDDLSGQSNYRLEMEALAGELGLDTRFVGFQKNVADWLKASDIAVVPSHVEPLGNATLEAMALGLPVIGSNIGGIPEMIVGEETGLLVPPRSPQQLADAIQRLLANKLERTTFGENGRLRCEACFSLKAHVNAVLEEYQRCLPPVQIHKTHAAVM